MESLTKTAEQLKLKVKAEVSVNDYKHFAREDDKANDRWPVKGGMGVNQSFAFSLQQGQFFQPRESPTNAPHKASLIVLESRILQTARTHTTHQHISYSALPST